MIFKAFLRVIMGIIAILILIFFTGFPHGFSTGHPNYQEYARLIDEAEPGTVIDFSAVNSGNWQTLCIFGAFTNPSRRMTVHGKVSIPDRVLLFLAGLPFLHIGEVEEGESMIAYVDENGFSHFIRFDSVPYRGLEDVHLCTDRDNPNLVIVNR